ncbi:hypothetical protein ACG91D_01535 [Acinetobacter guillouiae]|uniref:hypothetical protein n=1 Tax=Acinetobacter guillouiae TaxID=106649 RepID=UPI003AF85DF0
MDINKEREAFEQLQNPKFFQRAVYLDNSNAYVVNDEYRDDLFSLEWVQEINYGWLMWQAAKATPEGFVLVDKKHTEDWYLDDHEGMWWDQDGIDNSLCDLDPGQVQAVEHKEYLITESNTLYAAKVWDESNDQVGYWEFFKTKDEAEKVAAYCKAKFKGDLVEAQEQNQ